MFYCLAEVFMCLCTDIPFCITARVISVLMLIQLGAHVMGLRLIEEEIHTFLPFSKGSCFLQSHAMKVNGKLNIQEKRG